MTLEERIQADAEMLEHLGIEVNSAALPAVELALEVRGVLANALGFCHGGVVYSLADTACAYALGGAGFAPATIDASISYLKAGKTGDRLRTECDILRTGSRVGTVNVRVLNQHNELCAVYRGTCMNASRS